eukprot:m.88818 g.88818  ORF g.88818 m.88818 type:complete len:405 (-) comp8816_c5_seq1:2218-3432(-)
MDDSDRDMTKVQHSCACAYGCDCDPSSPSDNTHGDEFLSDVHIRSDLNASAPFQVSRFVFLASPIDKEADEEGEEADAKIYSHNNTGTNNCKDDVDKNNTVDCRMAVLVGRDDKEERATVTVNNHKFNKRDVDNDPPRTRKRPPPTLVVNITHGMKTVLDDVGLQVWRGALLMADFLIEKGRSQGKPALPEKKDGPQPCILELGSGVGLASIVAAHMFPNYTIYTTEIGNAILHNCQRNINNNCLCAGCRYDGANQCKSHVSVKNLDWGSVHLHHNVLTDNVIDDIEDVSRWKMNEHDWDHISSSCSFIMAADVVYVEEWTEKLVQCMELLLRHTTATCCYISLEKRLNFTLEALDVACPAYTHFERLCLKNTAKFIVQRITPPQYSNYDRVPQLELYEISLQK